MDFTATNIIYNKLRRVAWLNTFVILTRYLIAFAFIPSGLKKIMGQRFTQISTDNPIGFFFEGLYQSGFYWNFIGWAQVIAALLLMTQRFATLGAICFFFIISNIWVITISLSFSGTWVITSLMLLAVIMLLAWDYHKLKFIFYADNFPLQNPPANYPPVNGSWIITGFILFVWSIAGLLLLERLDASNKLFLGIWLAGIFLIVLTALYLNKKNK
ncbi:hypothetical protein BH11BAC3_BH11BAC3_32260 [soil metagenome]